MARIPTRSPLPHPGEILQAEFLDPLGVTQTALAERIGVSFRRINELVNGKRGITPDTALRLAKAFGTTPEFWLNLQQAWDLWHAMHGPDAARIERIERIDDAA